MQTVSPISFYSDGDGVPPITAVLAENTHGLVSARAVLSLCVRNFRRLAAYATVAMLSRIT